MEEKQTSEATGTAEASSAAKVAGTAAKAASVGIKTKIVAVAAAAAIAVAGGAVGVAVVTSSNSEDEPAETTETDETPQRTLSYETGVTALDEDSLQKAVDEMYAKAEEGNIALEYKNDAYSTDGVNVSCYIGNSLSNEYDMYIGIYSDSSFTDELYLSGLFRPGEAIQNITLNHSLESGDHRVYVAYTQVEDDLATIHGQVFVTMDIHVELNED